MNRIAVLIVAGIFSLSIGCSIEDKISLSQENRLTGVWEGNYTMEKRTAILEPDNGNGSIEVDLVSRFTLGDNSFQIHTYEPDANPVEVLDDFHRSGTYQLQGDTLILISSGYDRRDYFHFSLSGDNLTLSEIPIASGDNLYSISLISLPWIHGQSLDYFSIKHSGSFIRVE